MRNANFTSTSVVLGLSGFLTKQIKEPFQWKIILCLMSRRIEPWMIRCSFLVRKKNKCEHREKSKINFFRTIQILSQSSSAKIHLHGETFRLRSLWKKSSLCLIWNVIFNIKTLQKEKASVAFSGYHNPTAGTRGTKLYLLRSPHA